MLNNKRILDLIEKDNSESNMFSMIENIYKSYISSSISKQEVDYLISLISNNNFLLFFTYFKSLSSTDKTKLSQYLTMEIINKLFIFVCCLLKEIEYSNKILSLQIIEWITPNLTEDLLLNAYIFEKNQQKMKSSAIGTIGKKTSKHFKSNQIKFEKDLNSYFGFFASGLDDERGIIKKKTLSVITYIIKKRKFLLFGKKSFNYIIELLYDDEESIRLHTVLCLKEIISEKIDVSSDKIDILYSVLNEKNKKLRLSVLDLLSNIRYNCYNETEKFLILLIELRKLSEISIISNTMNKQAFELSKHEDEVFLKTIRHTFEDNKNGNLFNIDFTWVKKNLRIFGLSDKVCFLKKEPNIDDFYYKVFSFILFYGIYYYKKTKDIFKKKCYLYEDNYLDDFDSIENDKLRKFYLEIKDVAIPKYIIKHWRYYLKEHNGVFLYEEMKVLLN